MQESWLGSIDSLLIHVYQIRTVLLVQPFPCDKSDNINKGLIYHVMIFYGRALKLQDTAEPSAHLIS